MKLFNVEIIKLLPAWMREDAAVQGLAAGAGEIIHELTMAIELLTTWDKIDSMDETQLDEMAWELNIRWYNDAADIGTKQQLIKESDLVYAKMGTKLAVESVVQAYFGAGYTEEWFEYGGEPYHFKIFCDNPALTNEKRVEFLQVLEMVKRKSTWIDDIMITLTGKLPLKFWLLCHQSDRETHKIGLS